jgi:RimJ/RimL family protein N-acetyltransferase
MLQLVERELVPEIGYHIVRRAWGQGYATEAATACRDLVLGGLGYGRVVSIVAPDNVASRRVAEKVHATMREFIWEKNGRTMILFETSSPR